MLQIILILLIIYIIFLYKNNKIINKGGHYIDRKIRNYTIFPSINRTAISIHDFMHKIFQYGDIKEDKEVNNILKTEIKKRLKENQSYNKTLNNTYMTNKTALNIQNKIQRNKNIINDIINDIS
jgi:hypothetical protein